MNKPSRFEKIAEYLADRYVETLSHKTAQQDTKTTPDQVEGRLWDRFRPENPDRPGANWWTGLGGGALTASLETGVGEHGLTDSLQRAADRRNLRKNPLGQFNTPEFRTTISGNEQAKFLHDLFNRQIGDTTGKSAIGNLLSKNYGTIRTGDPAEVNRLYGEIQKIVGSGDTELARKFKSMTSKPHEANKLQGQKILNTLDDLLSGRNAKFKLDPQGTNLLTKLRTSIGPLESADELDALTRNLQNLSASVKGGKKGVPQGFVFDDSVRKLLNTLSAAPVKKDMVADPGKVKDMVSALGQFTKGRNVPTLLRRLGRGGTAAGIGTAIGAYGLPSLVDFGKWALRRGNSQQ